MIALMTWLACFVLLSSLRLGLAWRYAAQQESPSSSAGNVSSVTIVQPILSGDKALARSLASNMEANPAARFLWLVDDDDHVAIALTDQLRNERPQVRVDVVQVPGPRDGENPKMAKLIVAGERVESDVLLVLDDDTILPPGGADRLAAPAMQGALATGLPVYISHGTLAERLVAGMINGQALATYFAMAAVEANKTINGMVYAVSKSRLDQAGGFMAAGHELTDDYAVARLCQRNGLPIDQTAVIAKVVISFETLADAGRVVRRWLIFANRYLARNAGAATLGLVVLPTLLPVAGLVAALVAGWPWGLTWLAALAAKAIANGLLLQQLAGVRITPGRIACEMAADVLLPLMYVTALVRPQHLTWRTRRIELSGDTIRYR